jgi:hypothetical protein
LNRFGAGDGRTGAYGDMSIFRIPEAPTWTLFVIGLVAAFAARLMPRRMRS